MNTRGGEKSMTGKTEGASVALSSMGGLKTNGFQKTATAAAAAAAAVATVDVDHERLPALYC